LIDQSGHNHGPLISRSLGQSPGSRAGPRRDCPQFISARLQNSRYGKYKYQAQKKAAEARKKQKVVEVKEIKLRPMIDDHDYDVKMRSMQRFF